MTKLTNNPKPPFRVVDECLGHAFDYATAPTVLDANGKMPWEIVPRPGSDVIIDREWCERKAAELNAKYGEQV